jgi:transcriptional regulator with XRE-family HTH domain
MTYATRKLSASPNLHEGAFFTHVGCGTLPAMARNRTYIRAWREKKGYTLEDMLGRLEAIDFKITGASLSRIERGKQPYTQDTLEAIATALGVTPADLLENDPDIPDAIIIDFLRHLSDREKSQAETVLKAMFGDRA